MVRIAKSKGKKGKALKNEREAVNSDNEHYADDDGGFDPKNPFEDDEIEKFHSGRDKILLDNIKSKSKKKTTFDYSSNEEEVLAFDDDEDDDDDDSDMDDNVYGTGDEDEDEEADMSDKPNDDDNGDDLPSSWGRRKSAYYSGNKIENDEDAELEEEEAKAMQARMMKQLDASDFGLDAFRVVNKSKALKTGDELESDKLATAAFGDSVVDQENLQKIAQNLTSLSKKEKLEFLQRESPELFELIREFKLKLEELENTLLPLFNSIKNGQIPHSNASDFIVNKTKLYLTYCCHLSFYFVLKAERLPIENHPIVKNILQFRNLTKQINVINEKLETEVVYLVESIQNNRQINFVKPSKLIKRVNFKARMKQDNLLSDEDDSDAEVDADKQVAELGTEQSEKRAINYQISKNKGLTPKRNKMYRNPRVKYRIKAHTAIVKRKSIVPKVRTQEKRYMGESTGIRTTVIRGVKIK